MIRFFAKVIACFLSAFVVILIGKGLVMVVNILFPSTMSGPIELRNPTSDILTMTLVVGLVGLWVIAIWIVWDKDAQDWIHTNYDPKPIPEPEPTNNVPNKGEWQ